MKLKGANVNGGDVPGWLGLRPGWMAQGGDERTDGRTENLPILQDFIPYRGSGPKTADVKLVM